MTRRDADIIFKKVAYERLKFLRRELDDPNSGSEEMEAEVKNIEEAFEAMDETTIEKILDFITGSQQIN